MKKEPGVQVSSPLINNGYNFCFDNLTKSGFFTNSLSITLRNEYNDRLILDRIFPRIPKDLNGFTAGIKFGRYNVEQYNLYGNTLELPSFYNGNTTLYYSISNGTLYIHDMKHVRFHDNALSTSVILSAVNIDNIEITDTCQYFNKIYAKNTNFYVNTGNERGNKNVSTNFFNLISGSTFINCNIYVYR